MTLYEMIENIPPRVRADAEELIKLDNFFSLNKFTYRYEALIFIGNSILFPEVILDRKINVYDYTCQCSVFNKHNICVHIAATLIGIEKMIQTKQLDYHEAVKKT